MKHFGWMWVGAIRSDNDYGNSGLAAFIQAARHEGVCVEYSEAISRTDPGERVARVVGVIKSSSARVLVAFLAQSEMRVLLEEAKRQSLTGLQWVGSESWITAAHLATGEYAEILAGSLGFTIRKAQIKGLRDFLLQVHPDRDPQNYVIREFWEEAFGCSLQSDTHGKPRCSGSERLRDVRNSFTDVSELRISNNVYKAAYAVAQALQGTLKCGTNSGATSESCAWDGDLKPEQVKVGDATGNEMRSVNA